MGAPGRPDFSAAFVMWGDAFGAAYVNALVRDIAAHTAAHVHFVLFADRDYPGLDPRVEVRALEDPWGRAPVKKRMLTKMVIFEPGQFDAEVPVLFFDLDTMVQGDVAPLARHAAERGGLWACRASWALARPLLALLGRLTGGRQGARYNGSVYGFLPGAVAEAYARFRADLETVLDTQDPWPKRFNCDDRWLSARARPLMRT